MGISGLQRYMRVAGYSPKTIEAYSRCVEEIGTTDLMMFLDKKAREGKSSYTLNQYHSAYKLYTIKVLNKSWSGRFPYAKRHKKIPVVLSREEIARILAAEKNKKHRLMLALAYGAGLRVSEVVNLKVQDIELYALTLWVRQAKGKKDRLTIVPSKLVRQIEFEMDEKDKQDYLFESARGGKLTTRTAQAVFETAIKKAQINKNATFHSLRHSFATHLLENCVNIRYIQELLGHSSISTTQIYTKVANPALQNIRSPL